MSWLAIARFPLIWPGRFLGLASTNCWKLRFMAVYSGDLLKPRQSAHSAVVVGAKLAANQYSSPRVSLLTPNWPGRQDCIYWVRQSQQRQHAKPSVARSMRSSRLHLPGGRTASPSHHRKHYAASWHASNKLHSLVFR